MTEIGRFRRVVWAQYRKYGRHNLPWRPPSLKLRKGKKDDVFYRVLVSEIMLQQTQVERVIPFYVEFTKRFPTVKSLARARLSEVLKCWQGLGYNRRAKMLHQAAKDIVARFSGKFPEGVVDIESLPGVGPYTARAIAVFAYNQNAVLVETNIRTVVIHHFFRNKTKVSNAEVEKVLAQALPRSLPAGRQGRAREWYSALMDYGARLKRTGKSYNVKIKKYVKQSKFAGSLREARGVIVRELSRGAATPARLVDLLGAARRAQMRMALRALWKEGLVKKSEENYMLAD